MKDHEIGEGHLRSEAERTEVGSSIREHSDRTWFRVMKG